jgi:hypothetical protein
VRAALCAIAEAPAPHVANADTPPDVKIGRPTPDFTSCGRGFLPNGSGADMLGLHRGVTEAGGKLQKLNLIAPLIL